eukprot:5390583-Pyramimonas_sp.AAC.1
MGGDRGGAGGDFSRGPRWQCRHCGCKRNESYFQYCKHCKKWWKAPVESAPADDKRTARGDPAALRRTAESLQDKPPPPQLGRLPQCSPA